MDVSLLQTGQPALIELLRAAIRREGPITFAHFMAEALYHPAHGFYSSGRAQLGREGDYFTSVSVGPLFGRLLAAQFAEIWKTMGRPNDFVVVEQGAHGGEFAHDLLSATEREHGDFFTALRYQILEPFEILQTRQAQALTKFADKLRWHSSIAEMPTFRGLHFSNELIDAFPTHLVRWTGAEWCERLVTERDGKFVFIDGPLSDRRLAEHLRAVTWPLPAGYETEVNLAAQDWIETLAP
ncbi:MAG: SAM-dependent methyltransferase, partial [Chthoniobacterales bacterium]